MEGFEQYTIVFSEGSVVVTYTVLMSSTGAASLFTDMNDALYLAASNGTLGNYTFDLCSFNLAGKERDFWS